MAKNYYYSKKKYYRYKYYKRRTKASYEYLRVKLEFHDTLVWPAGGQAAGDIRFQSIAQAIPPNYIAVQNLLVGSAYWANLQSMFSFYKVTGVTIEAVPSPSNIGGNGQVQITNLGPIFIGYVSANGAQVYDRLSANNNALCLDPTSRKRKYVSLLGGTSSYKAMNENFVGGITVANNPQMQGTATDSPMWALNISIYVLCKKSKI